MSDLPPHVVTVLWSDRDWRCECWTSADGPTWLVLYQQSEIVLRRPVANFPELQEIARSWHRSMLGDQSGLVMPEPSRRRVADRRQVFRGGRRAGDRAADKAEPGDHD